MLVPFRYPSPFPFSLAANPGNIFGKLGAFGLSTISKLPSSTRTLALAKWLIQVANDQLGMLGYYNKISTLWAENATRRHAPRA